MPDNESGLARPIQFSTSFKIASQARLHTSTSIRHVCAQPFSSLRQALTLCVTHDVSGVPLKYFGLPGDEHWSCGFRLLRLHLLLVSVDSQFLHSLLLSCRRHTPTLTLKSLLLLHPRRRLLCIQNRKTSTTLRVSRLPVQCCERLAPS